MSEHWQRKMKTCFTLHDVDNNEIITDKDFEQLARQFAEAHKASPEQTQNLVDNFRKLWQRWTLAAVGDEKQNLTFPLFLESIKIQMNNPEEYSKVVGDTIRNMFDLMDLNKDGYLQQDEHRLFFGTVGLADSSFVDEAFASMDKDGDKKLSKDEFIAAYVDFMFGQDENSPGALFFGPLRKW